MAKRDLIFNHFWWKLTSLFLAAIVWLVVQRNGSTDNPLSTFMLTKRFPNHPLAVMRDVADKRTVRVNPPQVDITVSVSALNTTFSENDIQTFIDFSGNQDRLRSFRIRVFLPPDVKLVSIKPEQAFIEVVE